MKLLILTSLAFGLTLGCDPASSRQSAAAPSKPAAVESMPVPPPVPTESQKLATPGAQQLSKRGDIPNRLFQLRILEKTVVTAPQKTKLDCWVMDTKSKCQEGMMWLAPEDVSDKQGMIFVFADAQPRSFWMQNTHIPLDIIYMDEDGKVLNIAHGKPRDETSLPSKGASKYVLELKQGMAARFKIAAGTRLEISSSLRFKPDES